MTPALKKNGSIFKWCLYSIVFYHLWNPKCQNQTESKMCKFTTFTHFRRITLQFANKIIHTILNIKPQQNKKYDSNKLF